MKYQKINEEELKGRVGKDWFSAFDDTRIIGNIDFCISPKKQTNKNEPESFLWAEAKTGDFDVIDMFAQLIITIGKERPYIKNFPPAFLGVFDFKKIVFIAYKDVQDLFYQNDFNWTIAPSNHLTKEFILIKTKIESIIKKKKNLFDFVEDEKELKHFIKNNLVLGSDEVKIMIDKNNFVSIYLRWLNQVKPFIHFDWAEGKKQNIQDSDFFLADLFVDDKGTLTIQDDTPLKDELFVVFRNSHYEIAKENLKSLFNAAIEIGNKDKYEQFWKRYKRSPVKDFQQYIIDRRDLLMPQDVRERKGAFFTPQIWVELSQKYLADVLGENWQDEYYIWDCAAGTGNLLAGLTNKYNIYASTLDQADVNVMNDRIANGANLLEANVFQFDFLNDDFSKLPQSLQNIINNSEKRKKLVVYINPPYAEAGNKHTISGTGEHKDNTTNNNITHSKYKKTIGKASNELFTLFMTRIYAEIPKSKIGIFCKLKNLQSPNFKDFRNFFQAKLERAFIVPADTFDNVKGIFPIGFFIYNLELKDLFLEIDGDIYNKRGEYLGVKKLNSPDNSKGFINNWIKKIKRSNNVEEIIGQVGVARNDMQNKSLCYFAIEAGRGLNISQDTIIIDSIFLTVQSSINATWINDRDPFFYPNDGWQIDSEFKNNCFAFALFDGQNRITNSEGTNHWIPFTEQEVNAKAKFESNFMTDFIKGKLKPEPSGDLFSEPTAHRTTPLQFSPEAQDVFDAGRALWKYYHQQFNVNVNASLYDIREYFQGRNDSGKMNHKSEDQTYMQFITELRAKLKVLAGKIAPKVYEYGFLKE